MFPLVKFCESWYTVVHDIDAFFTIQFFEKILAQYFFFLKSKKGNYCKIFKNPLDKFFIFSN